MNYVGLDIHKAFTYGVIEDESGNVIKEDKFTNEDENFSEFLKECKPEETKIVMESTGVWEFIYNILDAKKYSVKLANPVRTKAIASARVKTDAVDAKTLADLLRANLVAESYIPKEDIRRLRDVTRQRTALVKGRTQIKNKIHAVLNRHGIKIPYKSLCPKAISFIKDIIKINLNYADINDVLVSYFNLLDQYEKELKFIENRIKDNAEKNKQTQLLETIPGIGSIRATEILAEIADINRFPDSHRLCSYAGLVPGIRQSGNTLKFGRLIKQSSKSLKYSLIESSWIAVRTKEANSLQLHYKRLVSKKGKQKAICAAARKMLCVIYAMLKKNEEFKA